MGAEVFPSLMLILNTALLTEYFRAHHNDLDRKEPGILQ